jgi:L-arabinose isomerase
MTPTEDSNSRFRAGMVEAELKSIHKRLDQIVKNQEGIQFWQLEVVKNLTESSERIVEVRHDLERSDRTVGAIAVVVSAVFSSIAGWFGSRQ